MGRTLLKPNKTALLPLNVYPFVYLFSVWEHGTNAARSSDIARWMDESVAGMARSL